MTSHAILTPTCHLHLGSHRDIPASEFLPLNSSHDLARSSESTHTTFCLFVWSRASGDRASLGMEDKAVVIPETERLGVVTQEKTILH